MDWSHIDKQRLHFGRENDEAISKNTTWAHERTNYGQTREQMARGQMERAFEWEELREAEMGTTVRASNTEEWEEN